MSPSKRFYRRRNIFVQVYKCLSKCFFFLFAVFFSPLALLDDLNHQKCCTRLTRCKAARPKRHTFWLTISFAYPAFMSRVVSKDQNCWKSLVFKSLSPRIAVRLSAPQAN